MKDELETLIGIIELLDQTEFTQFSFEQGDLRIAVSRGGAPLPAPSAPGATDRPAPTSDPAAPASSAAAPSAAATAPAAPSPSPRAAASTDTELADDEILVRAPLLGTFYRAPKPGAPAFVEVGDAVSHDTTLCIVEVMKLMTSVPAGAAGEVIRVLVEDGALVEFDQPLFVLRASA